MREKRNDTQRKQLIKRRVTLQNQHKKHYRVCCHGNHTHYSSEVSYIIGCTGGEPHEVNAVAIVEFCDYINGGKQPVRGRGERRGGERRGGERRGGERRGGERRGGEMGCGQSRMGINYLTKALVLLLGLCVSLVTMATSV